MLQVFLGLYFRVSRIAEAEESELANVASQVSESGMEEAGMSVIGTG
jgi:hypothetical protein